jgi:catechol 2,3-dioxygenase-like lactoylglutathione lyase family enzyme
MRDLTAIEIKAFVPAKDFELSKSFYSDLGFTVAWSSEGLAYIRHGNTSFFAAGVSRRHRQFHDASAGPERRGLVVPRSGSGACCEVRCYD